MYCKIGLGKGFFSSKKVYILEIKISEFLCKFQVRVADLTSEVLSLIFPLRQIASRSFCFFFPPLFLNKTKGMRKEEQREEDIILTQGSTLSEKKKKSGRYM